jgi:putative ABC transport system permease protein
MLLVARKNLFAERTRLAISVGGVALSVFLIGILLSLYRGWSQQVGGFVEDVPADLWAASDGTTDFVAAGSVLPDSLGVQLRLLPEVETVSPLIVRPLELHRSVDSKSDTFDVQLVGYDPAIGLGGPLEIADGKSPPGPGEIVVDFQMSKRHGVHIGDKLVRGSNSLVVVGFSRGGDFIYTQVGFATLDTAIDFLELEPRSTRTFFVVKLNDPTKRDLVASRVELAAPGVQMISGEDFAQETRDRILSNILPILIVVLVVAFVVGLAVAGLTIYTATVEKSREYGILKAEGFTNPYLYRVVFEQSMVTGILGFLLGAGVTVLLAPFAQDSVPQFVVWVRWQDILGIAGATLLMALIAAYIPVRRLSHIDPVTVFKG